MSNAPVVSITDELVAELEALAGECGQHGTNWYEPRHMAAFPEYACDQDFVIAASPATILALLRERAEMQQQLRAAMISVDNCELFRKDAERYQWLRELASGYPEDFEVVASAAFSAAYDCGHNFDLNIDAAMQEQKQ